MKRLLHARNPRNVTQAWIALVIITVATAGIALAERGVPPWVGWVVAALVAWKAWLVADHYLELADAAPVFRRIVLAFISLAPLALVVAAWLQSR